MSLVRVTFFSDGICAGNENFLQPKKLVKAEQEEAFFSSESAEKNRTGWVGHSVSLFNRTNANT